MNHKLYKLALVKKTAICFISALFVVSMFSFSPSDISNVALAADHPQKAITTVNGRPCAAGEVIIKFKPPIGPEGKATALESLGGEFKTLALDNTVTLTIPNGRNIEGYLAELNMRADVEYAQPNFAYSLDVTVNDPFAFPGAGEADQWYHDRINTFEAWEYTMGSGVNVAVFGYRCSSLSS